MVSGTDREPGNDEADVVQAAERRKRMADAEGIHHFTDEGQVEGCGSCPDSCRFELARQFLAERTGGVAGEQIADLVEIQQIQRMCVHYHRVVPRKSNEKPS